jgi:hypothetical protein
MIKRYLREIIPKVQVPASIDIDREDIICTQAR